MPVEGGGVGPGWIFSTAIRGLLSKNPNADDPRGLFHRLVATQQSGADHFLSRAESAAWWLAHQAGAGTPSNPNIPGTPRPQPSGGSGITVFPSSQRPPSSSSSRSRKSPSGVYKSSIDGRWYPRPPKGYTGRTDTWEELCRRRGAVWETKAAADSATRRKLGVAEPTPSKAPPKPPKAPTTEPTPNLPDAPKGPQFDLFPWLWLGQMIWDQRDAVTRAVFRTKLHIPVKPRPMPTPTALPAPPRIPSENFPPGPRLPPEPLTVPRIYTPRMKLPRTVQPGRTTDTLSVPTITARPLPTPKLSGPPKPMPVATLPKPSIFSKFDPLTLAYLLPRGSTIRGGKLRIVGDPLTANIPSPLTSPLGSFAGVPATADCSCSKSPKKRGKRKRRTVCYEGTYRETASGTRKLRRREVSCT